MRRLFFGPVEADEEIEDEQAGLSILDGGAEAADAVGKADGRHDDDLDGKRVERQSACDGQGGQARDDESDGILGGEAQDAAAGGDGESAGGGGAGGQRDGEFERTVSDLGSNSVVATVALGTGGAWDLAIRP